MTPPPREWYRDQYMISTTPSLLQLKAINDALDSEAVYWAKALPEDLLAKMLSKSLCFGLYVLPSSSSELAGKTNPKQVGLARLITDEVSMVYITDVYVLEEHQGQGLGKWMMDCVRETLDSWPELRRIVLVTRENASKRFYDERLGMKPLPYDSNGFEFLTVTGRGSILRK